MHVVARRTFSPRSGVRRFRLQCLDHSRGLFPPFSFVLPSAPSRAASAGLGADSPGSLEVPLLGVPRMVASMVHRPVFGWHSASSVLFIACSLQHSAADIGAGAWIREGGIEFAAFVANPNNNPTHPPSSGLFRSSVPAFRQAFSSNSAADVGADCSIGEGSTSSASSRSCSAALLRLRQSASMPTVQDDHSSFFRSFVLPFLFKFHSSTLSTNLVCLVPYHVGISPVSPGGVIHCIKTGISRRCHISYPVSPGGYIFIHICPGMVA